MDSDETPQGPGPDAETPAEPEPEAPISAPPVMSPREDMIATMGDLRDEQGAQRVLVDTMRLQLDELRDIIKRQGHALRT